MRLVLPLTALTLPFLIVGIGTAQAQQVQGPPDGAIAPPPANPTPAPAPIILPAQRPTPPATPAPAPAPPPVAARPDLTPEAVPTTRLPRPRAAPPANTAQDRSRAAPIERTPAPAQLQPQPQSAAPGAEQPSAPVPSLPAAAVPEAPSAPAATTDVASPSDDGGGFSPWWLALLALPVAGVVVARRRRRQPDAEPASPPALEANVLPSPIAVAPAPAPAVEPRRADPGHVTTRLTPRQPVPASAPTSAASVGSPRRADLRIRFQPIDAQSTLMNLRARYMIEIANDGAVAAEGVRVRIGLFAGSGSHPQGIAGWFAQDDGAAHHRIERIEAGGVQRIEGELAAPLDALKPVTLEGRLVAIPLVGVDVRYGHGPDAAPLDGQVGRAFVIGREAGGGAGTGKLAPFRLDQGPQRYDAVAQRDLGIGRVA